MASWPKLRSFPKKVWGHPLARGVNVDDGRALERHRRIVASNALLRKTYTRWYKECLPAYEATRGLQGSIVELGSGAGFLSRFIPDLITTDVIAGPSIRKVMDATAFDFPDRTLRAIFMIGCLHHLPRPANFFAEAERCLVSGGRLVLLEPNNHSVPQRILCRLLNHYEHFDETAAWGSGSANRMSNANLSVAWIMLFRDRERFAAEFPSLRILQTRYHTFLGYILSGGMTYRPFVPSSSWPLIAGAELLAKPMMKWLGSMMTIDMVKL